MSKHFVINGTTIIPGQDVTLRLPVASLPSGNRIYIKGHIYRSLNPGPVMLALGGVHGDEINGIEIVRRAVEEEFFKNLQQGSVIAIPLLNIYGFIN